SRRRHTRSTRDWSSDVCSSDLALTGQADGGDRTIRDARDLLWCSIDNDDSRDLDQLTVAVDAGGASRVLVAVADVDAGVPQGSEIGRASCRKEWKPRESPPT